VAAARSAVDTQARARLDEMHRSDRVHVAEVLAALDAALPPDRLLVQENGLQDMWSYVYPYWRSSAGGALAPSEQTSLGFGMAAAAGAKLALPDRAVAALGGDGAFNLFRSDLVTVAQSMVAAVWVVLDNGGYGWLQYQWNQRPPDQRQRTGTAYAFTTPLGSGTGEIAHQFGIWFRRVEHKSDLDAAVRDACTESAQGRPAVLEVAVSLADVPPGFEVLDGEFPAA
jgi:acetolactate synthase-1/2/3 large subunit